MTAEFALSVATSITAFIFAFIAVLQARRAQCFQEELSRVQGSLSKIEINACQGRIDLLGVTSWEHRRAPSRSRSGTSGPPDLKVRLPDLNIGSRDLKVRSPDLEVGSPDLKVRSPDLKVGPPDLKDRSPAGTDGPPESKVGLRTGTGLPPAGTGRPPVGTDGPPGGTDGVSRPNQVPVDSRCLEPLSAGIFRRLDALASLKIVRACLP